MTNFTLIVVATLKPKVTRQRQSIPTFLSKLFNMLQSNEHSEFIKWADQGTSFEIIDRVKFENEILPTYFKHKSFNSFVRQLNMYDFHKKSRSAHEQVFFHKSFLQGHEEKLNEIKRKTNAQYSANKIMQILQHPPFDP